MIRQVVLGVVVVLFGTTNGVCLADDITVLDPPQRLLVIVEEARAMAGNKPVESIPQGTILTVTRANGNWRFTPDFKGWVHVKEAIPLDRAITEMNAKLEVEENAAHYQLRGIALMILEEWEVAAQDFEMAYELGESSTNLHYNLGICYERMGEQAAALEEFDSILKAYPEEVPSLMARGNLLLQMKQIAAGLRDIDKAIELKPNADDAHNSRGIALRMQGKYAEAIKAYDKALEINPQRADSICNRGYARKQLGDQAGALKDYEAAYELAPASNSIRNDLAWLLVTSPDTAIRDPRRGVELSEAVSKSTGNQDADFLDTLAAAYAANGRFPAAIETVKLAISLIKQDADASLMRERLKLYEAEKPFVDSIDSTPK
ncbi:MAG TPA: tetratricopeptide repeat protein [Planctomicrobium sp.]|nr:tetratricopeptide repeat protein [Planctomicrobium sp.]